MKTMKVRVTGSDKHKWYKDKIGEVFTVDVTPHESGLHTLSSMSGKDVRDGILPIHFEVVPEFKVVVFDGKKYTVPEWVKFLTRAKEGDTIVGFEFKPTWSDCDGAFDEPMWHNTESGVGRVSHAIVEYEAPKPVGNLIVEV